MSNNDTIKDRFKELLQILGVGQKAFEVKCGMGNGTINNIKNGISSPNLEKIISAYPEINIEWIITGKGTPLKNENSNNNKQKYLLDGEQEVSNDISINENYRLVPIIHIDSVGGLHSSNSIINEPQYIEGYAPFVDAKEGDVCIIQSGDSMIPTCPSGSLLLLRQVINWREYFGYGNIFVLELTDGRRITKEVSRYEINPKDYIWCISHNPNVPDEELAKSMIASVWKVIKIQINKGW